MQVLFATVAPILCFGAMAAKEQGAEVSSAYAQYMRQGMDPKAGYHKFMSLYARDYQEKLDSSKDQYHTYIKQHALNSDDQLGKGYQQYMGEYMLHYKTFMDKSDRTQDAGSSSKDEGGDVPIEALGVQGLAASRPAAVPQLPPPQQPQRAEEPQRPQQQRAEEYRASDYRAYMLDGRGQEASAGYRKYLASYMERLFPGTSQSTAAGQQVLLETTSAKYSKAFLAVPLLLLLTMAIAAAAKVSRPQYWRRRGDYARDDSRTEALLATEA